MAESAPPDWWAHPDLDRCWAAIAARIEREGRAARGRTRLAGLTRAEQRALSGLLGRTVLGDRVEVDLATLDNRLRTRARVGLVAAAEAVLGRPLANAPARRAAREARRELPHTAYRRWRAAHPEATWEELDGWFEGLRRDGLLARTADPAALVTTALELIWERRAYLAEEPSAQLPEPIARTQLAARLFGDAHALDDGQRFAAVVLRAVEALAGPAGSRREQWEQIGVLVDRVSSTVMTLGMQVRPTAGAGERLAAACRSWAVVHLTWRDLDYGLAIVPGQTVLVSENPRVLEAAAEDPAGAGGGRVGFVCANGRPTLIVIALLNRLRAADTRLLYHGDFDWPGLDITNLLVRRCGVVPWRMGAGDYLAAPAQLALTGRRVHASWDPALAPAMERRGLAVHEEALLPGLVIVSDW